MSISMLNSLFIFIFQNLLPEIGTIQFYLVFCFYMFVIYNLVKYVFHLFIDKLSNKEIDPKTKLSKSFIEERIKKQKEAQELLSKYFDVKTHIESNNNYDTHFINSINNDTQNSYKNE